MLNNLLHYPEIGEKGLPPPKCFRAPAPWYFNILKELEWKSDRATVPHSPNSDKNSITALLLSKHPTKDPL